MQLRWVAPCALLLAGWALASCGSRTAVLDDLGASDAGSSGGGSGGTSGSSSGTTAPDSGACPSGESLCADACCGGTCTSGRCLVALVPDANGSEIAVDATSVYWMGGASGNDVMSVPLDGGTPKVLAANQAPAPWSAALSLALDGASIYWISGVSIMRMPVGGGALAVTLATGQRPNGLAVDATTVYWTDDIPPTNNIRSPWAATVMSIPSGGGRATTLASGQPSPQGIAVDADSIYWLDWDTGGVQKMPLHGGTVVTLATGPAPAYQTAALPLPVTPGRVAQSVCWTAGQSLLSAPVVGGVPSSLGASDNVGSIAVDSANVYWATSSALMRVPIGGGTPVTLATVGGLGVAVDATSIYWIGMSPPNPPAPMGGPVLKLTPK